MQIIAPSTFTALSSLTRENDLYLRLVAEDDRLRERDDIELLETTAEAAAKVAIISCGSEEVNVVNV